MISRVAAVLAAIAGCSFAATAGTPEATRVALSVRAERRVAELERDEIERAIQVRLARPKCALELVEVGEDSAPASIEAIVLIERWRERRVPGGRPVFNPNTGRDEPGFSTEVEIRYHFTLKKTNDAKVLYDKEERAKASVGTIDIPSFQPDREARLRALRWIVERVHTRLCDAVSDLQAAR